MTGSHVGATFKNHETVRKPEGFDIGAPSLMCRTHECRECMDALMSRVQEAQDRRNHSLIRNGTNQLVANSNESE